MTGPDVMLQPKAFAAMALVCHELVTNARKHGALSVPSGQISIESTADPDGNVGIFWREMGGPTVSAPERRGFGYTILAEVIPFEVDGISTPEFSPSGFTLAIKLPAATAECVSAAAPPSDASGGLEGMPDSGMLARLLAVSLVVEDNLFIALDVEDMLRKLGAVRVDIAKSVGEAIELIGQRSYSFALLDLRLGMGNSLPVARALLPTGTRMVFGTGYGEAKSLDAALASVPVMSKPYHPKSLARVLSRLPVPSGHLGGEMMRSALPDDASRPEPTEQSPQRGRARRSLRKETAILHETVERHFAPGRMTRDAYIRYLMMNRPFASIEPALEAASIHRVLPDWDMRRRRFDLDRTWTRWEFRPRKLVRFQSPMTLGHCLAGAMCWRVAASGHDSFSRGSKSTRDRELIAATRFLRHGTGIDLWTTFTAALSRIDNDPPAIECACEAARAAFSQFMAVTDILRPSVLPHR